MDSEQGERAIILIPIMSQEFYSQISRPDLWVLDKEGLDFSRVSCFINTEIFPLLHLNGITVTDTNTEGSYHAGKEFVIREDYGVDPDIF